MHRETMAASRPATRQGKQYHIECGPGDVAEYVLLPGDPDRVPKIAEPWDEKREVAAHREFRIMTGKLDGTGLSACSTGIGCPAAAIAVEELANVGAKTFIRVGSCGAIKSGIECGDLVIASGAVRLDGTSEQYVRPEYPAAASYEPTVALIQACEKLGYRYHVGIIASSDSFYLGQSRPGFKDYETSASRNLISDLRKANVIGFEMETSTVFVLANIYGLRAGSICAVYANRTKDEFIAGAGETECVRAANEAVKILSEWDAKKSKAGKPWYYPNLKP